MKPYKETRLIGRGKYPRRENIVTVLSSNIEVQSHPLSEGGYRPHILVKEPTQAIEDKLINMGFKLHKPFGKGHIDAYYHKPQIVRDTLQYEARINELVELGGKLV
jgi:hypothetical protein